MTNSIFLAIPLLFFLSPIGGNAQPCSNIQTYEATPSVPRERESFTLSASGEWCVNVTNTSSTIDLSDNTITFTVTITGGLLQVNSPWSASVNMEDVRHGKYTVVVRLNNASGGQVDEKTYRLDIKGGKGKP